MQYILLIYHSEASFAALSRDDVSAVYREYGDFTQSLARSGNFKAGDE